MKWPINVILTEASQACYGQVFSFMLQLKRVAWTLTDCWYRLKRDGESGLSVSFPFDPNYSIGNTMRPRAPVLNR